ncbi:hypothetical protein B0T22DRAFT_505646 [Podospora appendiculata]|uniref:NADH:flavin oxidoreductase/NADH oxidase N-terminal domain-containing protein n=1 Tax=Podospora appendiculata TaxID=314037 RepID=A0AAE0XHU5_9PEZI|nr:hypothetical protein B0T22DRAFT_505646 [Podospora appendiculata]
MTLKQATTTVKTPAPGAPGAPYYTPFQNPPVGTALSTGADVPTVFTPLKLRGLTLQNRFAVSPMCMYSADDGHLTDFHLMHIGGFAYRGAALTIIEATSVTPNGRITPQDSGLWADSQIAPLKRVVDFAHSQGQKVGIQLAHAGRKASCLPPWLHHTRGKSEIATTDVGGWPDNVHGPSAIPWSANYSQPKEMTVEEIESLVQSFAASAERAVKAGIDTIEIHGAHGYLITSFLSPISNKRTDQYGGSFANRTRLAIEIIKAIRAVIPETMPLLFRISATEWMEQSGQESWGVPQTIELAKLLPDLGVDLLDVSTGGNNEKSNLGTIHPRYQIDIAAQIRAALRADGNDMLIGGVGMITTAEMAKEVAQKQDGDEDKADADLVLIARQFLREPEFVLRSAHQLGVEVQWPLQYLRSGFPKGAQL